MSKNTTKHIAKIPPRLRTVISQIQGGAVRVISRQLGRGAAASAPAGSPAGRTTAGGVAAARGAIRRSGAAGGAASASSSQLSTRSLCIDLFSSPPVWVGTRLLYGRGLGGRHRRLEQLPGLVDGWAEPACPVVHAGPVNLWDRALLVGQHEVQAILKLALALAQGIPFQFLDQQVFRGAHRRAQTRRQLFLHAMLQRADLHRVAGPQGKQI